MTLMLGEESLKTPLYLKERLASLINVEKIRSYCGLFLFSFSDKECSHVLDVEKATSKYVLKRLRILIWILSKL